MISVTSMIRATRLSSKSTQVSLYSSKHLMTQGPEPSSLSSLTRKRHLRSREGRGYGDHMVSIVETTKSVWKLLPSVFLLFLAAKCSPSLFSRRRGHTLEHTVGGCPAIPFTSGLLPASEDIPLPQIISWCCVTGRLRFHGLSNGLLLF